MLYDCIIVGGGIAGLQAAIQLGRSARSVLVADAGYGRSTLCRRYGNVLGWPDGVSGGELRRIGREQAAQYGVCFAEDEITVARKDGDVFELRGKNAPDLLHRSRTLLLATGLLDRFPPVPGLVPCLGLTVYVCPDCDGHEVQDRRTVIMGAGDIGANMALYLHRRTKDILYVNHEAASSPIGEETAQKLKTKGIAAIEQPLERVLVHGDGRFAGVVLASGQTVEGERGFIAFGGNEVRTELAAMLGVERLENKHIVTDPRTKMTNVPNVWAAGDATIHAEQVTIAMGEGSLAAIWINKVLVSMEGE